MTAAEREFWKALTVVLSHLKDRALNAEEEVAKLRKELNVLREREEYRTIMEGNLPTADDVRGFLVEKRKAGDMAEQLSAEITVLDDALRAYELDIEKLQTRLREARSRQTAIAARLESAENRVKLRSLLASERVDEAMARFDSLERRVDHAEGRADALSLAQGKPNLADEIAALGHADKVDEELAAMKAALNTTKEG